MGKPAPSNTNIWYITSLNRILKQFLNMEDVIRKTSLVSFIVHIEKKKDSAMSLNLEILKCRERLQLKSAEMIYGRRCLWLTKLKMDVKENIIQRILQ